MKKALIVIEADRQWARARITFLERAIQDLGPEFYDVFNQSSETWHDNAPFDALRDKQAVLDAELQHLRKILHDSLPTTPKPKNGIVGIGSVIVLEGQKGNHSSYEIAGDWTYRAGQLHAGSRVVSAGAPIAKEVIGKRVGEMTAFGKIVQLTNE